MPQGGARGQNLGHPNKVCSVCLFKQLLDKEGWASDMFITSTFSVIRSRSLWHYFHAPVILPYISKTISWINVILGILVLCDTTIDILTNVVHLDLYFLVQWFCLMSWMLFNVWTSLFGIMNQYDPTVDLKVNVGWVTYISWSSDFILHLEDNLMYDYHSLGLCNLYFMALWVCSYLPQFDA